MIWITSDTHYAHTNMCAGITRWSNPEENCRSFKTLQEMNYAIVDTINSNVLQDDILYHLGDWSFGGEENIHKFYDQLICKNIHLILGNHDKHIKNNENNNKLFTIEPQLCKLQYEDQQFILSHYPIQEWENMDKGSIHLHGHSHGKLNNNELNIKYRRMDVGLDSYEFRPYTIDEIIHIMDKREIKKHHK